MRRSDLINNFLRIFPIKKRKIMFMSRYGTKYDCNPKYLSKYMVEHCPEWDIVWALPYPEKYKIEGVRKVKFGSVRYFYELATCRVFITNARMHRHFKKRKGQFYIQTWHSSLRLKKIEKDIEEILNSGYVERAKQDSKQMDLLLSGCQKSTEIFKRCFWYDGPILSSGTPREDYLLNANDDEKMRIRQALGIEKGKKILLYAPTFRHERNIDIYNIDFHSLMTFLEKKTSEEWIFLMRLHPEISYFSNHFDNKEPFFMNVTLYEDIQELLLVADIVISDYSSLSFDYMFTRRPCFLYVPDLEVFAKEKGRLNFNIEDLPFPFATNNEQLLEIIDSFSESIYLSKMNHFLEFIGTFENGHACETVINYINNTIK